jgi:hypothetical protein
MRDDNRAADGRLDRRRFTVEMAAALLGGAAITIGCGGGGSPSSPAPVPTPTPTPSGPAAATGIIDDNHGHEAVISGAQLLTGDALALNIKGGASHQHMLTLSSDEVVRIRRGERITKASSNDVGLFGAHEHFVYFN